MTRPYCPDRGHVAPSSTRCPPAQDGRQIAFGKLEERIGGRWHAAQAPGEFAKPHEDDEALRRKAGGDFGLVELRGDDAVGHAVKERGLFAPRGAFDEEVPVLPQEIVKSVRRLGVFAVFKAPRALRFGQLIVEMRALVSPETPEREVLGALQKRRAIFIETRWLVGLRGACGVIDRRSA